MPVFAPGGQTTYDYVRDWALDAAGFGSNSAVACPVDSEVVDGLLLNALQQMYTQVWQDEHYQQTWQFTIAAGDEQPKLANVVLSMDQIFQPRFKVLERMVRQRDHKLLYECPDFPRLGAAAVNAEPQVLEYSKWGTDLAVTPPSTQDEDYQVFGYRELNRTIFTVTQPNDLVTWQIVDLPDEYVEIYQKIVLGFLLVACREQQLGQHWLSVASDELRAILDTNGGSDKKRSGRGEELVMGGGYTGVPEAAGPYLLFALPVGP